MRLWPQSILWEQQSEYTSPRSHSRGEWLRTMRLYLLMKRYIIGYFLSFSFILPFFLSLLFFLSFFLLPFLFACYFIHWFIHSLFGDSFFSNSFASSTLHLLRVCRLNVLSNLSYHISTPKKITTYLLYSLVTLQGSLSLLLSFSFYFSISFFSRPLHVFLNTNCSFSLSLFFLFFSFFLISCVLSLPVEHQNAGHLMHPIT